MKKALLLLSFVHLLAACTNDIEILPNDESQKLIVNALINANKTNNAIFLALSGYHEPQVCLLYTSPSPRDKRQSRMPSSA